MTFKEIINSDKPVLVDFFAEWCGPCKMMPAILKQVKNKVGDTAIILKIDVDKNQPVAMHYNVQSIPTIILFKNGEIIWRAAGVQQAPQLINLIEQHL